MSKCPPVASDGEGRRWAPLELIDALSANDVIYSCETNSKGCRTLADFFLAELQIFCRDQIGLKFFGTSACRTLADRVFVATIRVSASISAMLEKTLGYVTLMTIPHWLRYARAPTNCLGPPHTSRQGPTRLTFWDLHCQMSPDKPRSCRRLV